MIERFLFRFIVYWMCFIYRSLWCKCISVCVCIGLPPIECQLLKCYARCTLYNVHTIHALIMQKKQQQGNRPNESKSMACMYLRVCMCVCKSLSVEFRFYGNGYVTSATLTICTTSKMYTPAYCVLMVCHQCYDI